MAACYRITGPAVAKGRIDGEPGENGVDSAQEQIRCCVTDPASVTPATVCVLCRDIMSDPWDPPAGIWLSENKLRDQSHDRNLLGHIHVSTKPMRGSPVIEIVDLRYRPAD